VTLLRRLALTVAGFLLGYGGVIVHRRTLGRYRILGEVKVKDGHHDPWWPGVVYFCCDDGLLYVTSSFRLHQQFIRLEDEDHGKD
jgi:hypothetical protein